MENTSPPSDKTGVDADPWRGLRSEARSALETRDYSRGILKERVASTGLQSSELVEHRAELDEAWIAGVEIIGRRVFQQPARGYFAELTRLNEGALADIGLVPSQWASALMHRDSAKGFHIHPPYVPDGTDAAKWFQSLYLESPQEFERRPYDREQWDVMFFLTSICEMILVDEREGLPRRVMRFTIHGDDMPGPNNAAVVIPAGVAHGLRNIGSKELIMVYGTSTSFNPDWEGRIESEVERSRLPRDWEDYLERHSGPHASGS